MTISETLLPEYDQEIATTRQFIERIPAKDAAWKPHPKSAALGALAEDSHRPTARKHTIGCPRIP